MGRRARAPSSASTRQRIAVGGDSAGGNLAAAVALLARDRGGPALALQLLVYPVTDARLRHAVVSRERRGLLPHREARCSGSGTTTCRPRPSAHDPVRLAAARARTCAGLPPALVITAEYDPLRDEGEAYAERLREAGVPTSSQRYDGDPRLLRDVGLLAQVARDAVDDAVTAVRRGLGG